MKDHKNNPNAHLTAKEREKVSFPTRWLYKQNLLKGTILDYGSGFGADIRFLNSQGLDAQGYDPHYKPNSPDVKFDTIICQYVLNVLLPEEQTEVLMSVSEHLKPTGQAFFTVRRDLKRTGFRTHWIHKKKTYQCNVSLPFRSIFKNQFCEIYEYRHITQFDNGKTGIFENPSKEAVLLSESAIVYSILDKYPVSKGHTLVIPKRKSETYFDLTDKEETAIWMMVKRVKNILDKKYKPEGYNIGFNVNQTGGQTVFHTHIHVIPRYSGDVDNPRGGIRNVIPGKGDY